VYAYILMGCHTKRGFGVSGYLVAGKFTFGSGGRKWRRMFGKRVRFAWGRRFGACVACEGGKNLVDGGRGGRGIMRFYVVVC
jgi:hypothetical protein